MYTATPYTAEPFIKYGAVQLHKTVHLHYPMCKLVLIERNMVPIYLYSYTEIFMRLDSAVNVS